MAERRSLIRYAWLSIAASALIILLKAYAYWITDSVGLLSDALESVVNLVSACAMLIALTIAARPADEDHQYGHDKAEYFSSGLEGGLILFAAVGIAWAALERLMNPRDLEQMGLGLAVSFVASMVNFAVARILLSAGRQHDSITLEADARHLMTDVWTSIGVLVGVGAVAVTGWSWLDPAVALAVAANIVWTGLDLLRRSVLGLMDTALAADEQAAIRAILDAYCSDGIRYHALRTRRSGARRFVSMHVLVPGAWTVRSGHDLAESIEARIRERLANTTITIHLEPLEDPRAWRDAEIAPLTTPDGTPAPRSHG
ncbi:MAG TPA: cation diffusion facilitator family transporter [Burkholderiales bacterium]|nr:cation diffusion facilitator family transporter [Burkholderiales bacterium]